MLEMELMPPLLFNFLKQAINFQDIPVLPVMCIKLDHLNTNIKPNSNFQQERISCARDIKSKIEKENYVLFSSIKLDIILPDVQELFSWLYLLWNSNQETKKLAVFLLEYNLVLNFFWKSYHDLSSPHQKENTLYETNTNTQMGERRRDCGRDFVQLQQ